MLWNPAQLPDLSGRTFAVTGATAGIGYFAAEQLAAAGAHIVLASRSRAKLEAATATLREHVPHASSGQIVIDLASLDSVARAADEIAALPRLDGVLLNGGTMDFSRTAMTADGIPVLLGTHVVANVALIAQVLPALIDSARRSGKASRIVHTSTGFVAQFDLSVDDVARTPRTAIGAYTKAKTITEVFAFELDRRLRAAGEPVASIVTRPGVGVDAKTPRRAGIRDESTPHRRNPYTPWAQGKDSAAWSAVRALADPSAAGGEYFSPAGRLRGEPVRVEPLKRTATPDPALAASVWKQLERLAGVPVRV